MSSLLRGGRQKVDSPKVFVFTVIYLDRYTVLTWASSMEKMMMASGAGIISSGIIGLPTNGQIQKEFKGSGWTISDGW